MRDILKIAHERTDNLQKLTSQSESELKQHLADITQQISTLSSQITSLFASLDSAADFQSGFDSVYQTLIEIFSQLPEEGSSDITRQTRETINERTLRFQASIRQINVQMEVESNRIAALEDAKNNHGQECPNCHHKFFPGYSDEEYLATKERLGKLNEQYQATVDELELCQAHLESVDQILALRSQYAQIARSWPILSPLWELLSDAGSSSPKKSRMLLESVLRDIPIVVKIEALQEEFTHYTELLQIAEKESGHDLNQQQAYVQETELRLARTQDQIRDYERELKLIERLLETLNKVFEQATTIESCVDQREQYLNQLQDSLRVEHFNRLIGIFREEIAMLEQTLSKINIQQSLLAQLKQQNEQYQEDIRLLKLADRVMSPSSGLIAKGLIGFINSFIARMNHVVKQIWTYPLEILPVAVDDDTDLNYEFPVEFDHRYKAPDIRPTENNKATCDVFDLAFRIVAAECLGLQDWPLQLDEFGASFDNKHRNLAFQVTSSLVASTNIPQIFMVAHIEQSYGSLKNCDVTVLDDNNVILPEDIAVNAQTSIT
jgi:tetratricopeptide (TPR) repeat protein